MRLNPIVATLGTNALLYGAVLWYTGGIPRTTTARLASVGGGDLARHPDSGLLRRRRHRRRHGGRQAARRRAAASRASARTRPPPAPPGSACKRHSAGAYVWAQILYCLAAVLHAGIVNQPTAYEGDNYLLPSVAAVVLGGTSLLGGRGNLVATAIAALFLRSSTSSCSRSASRTPTRSLVQAAALAVGVALYTVNWGPLAAAPRGASRRASVAPT